MALICRLQLCVDIRVSYNTAAAAAGMCTCALASSQLADELLARGPLIGAASSLARLAIFQQTCVTMGARARAPIVFCVVE